MIMIQTVYDLTAVDDAYLSTVNCRIPLQDEKTGADQFSVTINKSDGKQNKQCV